MRRTLVVVGAVAALVLVREPFMFASLGEQVETAKLRAKDYGKRYGATDPVFKTDRDGRIIMECWSAPPEMWSYEQAVALSKELLPPAFRSVEPKALGRRDGYESFTWGDGTLIALRMSEGKYVRVQATAGDYTSPACR